MVVDLNATFKARHDLNRRILLGEQLRATIDTIACLNIALNDQTGVDQPSNEKLIEQVDQMEKRKALLESKLAEIEIELLPEHRLLDPETIVVVHCNACKSLVPFGSYFHHCTVCKEFDLCEACFDSSGHPHYCYKLASSTSMLHQQVTKQLTVSAALHTAFQVYADRPCLGERPIQAYMSRDTYSDVSSLSKAAPVTDTGFKYLTYSEVYVRARNLASGLIELFDLKPKDMVAICSENSAGWCIADIALATSGFVSVPIHTRMIHIDIENIVRNCALKGVICAGASVIKKFVEVRHNCPGSLDFIVEMDSIDSDPRYSASLSSSSSKKLLYSLEEVELIGSHNVRAHYTDAQKDDLITLIHTSGSTGVPKGAMLAERNWKALVADRLDGLDNLTNVCFDPLCHISERESMIHTLCSGGRVAMCRNPAFTFEDISLSHPSHVSATPRLWNVLYTQFQAELMRRKAECPPGTDLAKLRLDLVIEFRSIFGDRLESVGTGGAPTSAVVLTFLREMFGINMVSDGYGTTEAGSIADGNGDLMYGVVIKLEDVPEMGYFSTPPADQPPPAYFVPRGLLWVKTASTIQGYYNNPVATAASIKDGWFCTGDIVEYHEGFSDGMSKRRVVIIDRLKNFFKLAQGEFVAAERMETLYIGGCSMVEQIFVTCGDITKHVQNRITAVVVPNFRVLEDWIASEGLSGDRASLCSHPAVIAHVLSQLEDAAKRLNLRPFETPWGIHLEHEPFSISNGLMTSSNKLSRPSLERKYRPIVNSMLERRVLSLAELAIGLDLKSGFTFSEQGGDSLSAVRIAALARAKFGIDVNPQDLLNDHKSTDVVKDIEQDLELYRGKIESLFDEKQGSSTCAKGKDVLLTGATGFVGAFLLHQFVLSYPKDVTIRCIVRSTNDAQDAMNRIRQSLRDHGIWSDLFDGRIIPIAGDIGQDLFGLTRTEFESLASEVGEVYHCGALVNHVKNYHAHRSANVVGTFNVIQLCTINSHDHPRPLNYISTLSVFQPSSGTILDEMASLDGPDSKGRLASLGGYCQSKWVADNLALVARNRGAPVRLFRLGMVSWCSFNGRSNKQDWLTRCFAGLSRSACVPRSSSQFELVPVDFVARAIVQISLRSDTFNQTFHICDPDHMVRFTRIWEAVHRSISNGQAQDPVYSSWTEFWKQLLDAVQVADHPKELDALLMFDQGLPSDRPSFSIDALKRYNMVPEGITDESIRLFASSFTR